MEIHLICQSYFDKIIGYLTTTLPNIYLAWPTPKTCSAPRPLVLPLLWAILPGGGLGGQKKGKTWLTWMAGLTDLQTKWLNECWWKIVNWSSSLKQLFTSSRLCLLKARSFPGCIPSMLNPFRALGYVSSGLCLFHVAYLLYYVFSELCLFQVVSFDVPSLHQHKYHIAICKFWDNKIFSFCWHTKISVTRSIF